MVLEGGKGRRRLTSPELGNLQQEGKGDLVRAATGGQAESRGTCHPCGFTHVMLGWFDLGADSTNS